MQLCLNDCMKSLESFDEIKPTCHATVPIRTCVGCMCACQFNTCKTNVQQIEVTCPLLALGLVLLGLFFFGEGFLFISYLCLSAARQAGCSFSFVWFGLFGWLVSPFVNVLFACFLSFHAAVDQVLHRVFYPSFPLKIHIARIAIVRSLCEFLGILAVPWRQRNVFPLNTSRHQPGHIPP